MRGLYINSYTPLTVPVIEPPGPTVLPTAPLQAHWTFDQDYSSTVHNEIYEGLPQGGAYTSITNAADTFVRGTGALRLDSGPVVGQRHLREDSDRGGRRHARPADHRLRLVQLHRPQRRRLGRSQLRLRIGARLLAVVRPAKRSGRPRRRMVVRGNRQRHERADRHAGRVEPRRHGARPGRPSGPVLPQRPTRRRRPRRRHRTARA